MCFENRGIDHEQRKERNAELEGGKGKEMNCSPEPSEGTQSCQYLDFKLLTSRIVRE